jgi:hypothetical protein
MGPPCDEAQRRAAELQTFSTEWLTRLRLAPLYFGRKGLLARPSDSPAPLQERATRTIKRSQPSPT